jgi:hypothetical protein
MSYEEEDTRGSGAQFGIPALCLPTFSHFLIVNQTSLSLPPCAPERDGTGKKMDDSA